MMMQAGLNEYREEQREVEEEKARQNAQQQQQAAQAQAQAQTGQPQQSANGLTSAGGNEIDPDDPTVSDAYREWATSQEQGPAGMPGGSGQASPSPASAQGGRSRSQSDPSGRITESEWAQEARQEIAKQTPPGEAEGMSQQALEQMGRPATQEDLQSIHPDVSKRGSVFRLGQGVTEEERREHEQYALEQDQMDDSGYDYMSTGYEQNLLPDDPEEAREIIGSEHRESIDLRV